MKTKAAILPATGKDWEIVELDLDPTYIAHSSADVRCTQNLIIGIGCSGLWRMPRAAALNSIGRKPRHG